MKIKMIKAALFATIFLFSLNIVAQNREDKIWNSLLTEYVSSDGVVNYKGFLNDKAKLDQYIAYLGENPPDPSWSDSRKKAFWINVYNANTVWMILEHYPLKSITEIKEKGKTAWELKIIKVGDKKYSLNEVENSILRKEFNDPRIHFGINCASFSCPKLYSRAMTADEVDIVLDKLAKEFINDKSRNDIKQKKIEISKLFKWYGEDFIKEGTLIDFLNRYSDIQIDKNAKVDYLEYNWSLNE